MNKLFPYILTFFGLMLLAADSFAAMGPPCWPPPCVPVDGGLSFLLIAGAAYGGKKLFNSRKKQNTEKAE